MLRQKNQGGCPCCFSRVAAFTHRALWVADALLIRNAQPYFPCLWRFSAGTQASVDEEREVLHWVDAKVRVRESSLVLNRWGLDYPVK